MSGFGLVRLYQEAKPGESIFGGAGVSDVVERVARAMWEKRREIALRSDIPLEEWGDGMIPRANGIDEEARAAIDAMGATFIPYIYPA